MSPDRRARNGSPRQLPPCVIVAPAEQLRHESLDFKTCRAAATIEAKRSRTQQAGYGYHLEGGHERREWEPSGTQTRSAIMNPSETAPNFGSMRARNHSEPIQWRE